MDGPGDSLKEVFEDTLLDLRGSDIRVYRDWKTDAMTSTVCRGIKESTTEFQFPVDTQIDTSDVLQIGGSRSFWQVIDIDEEVKFGIATNLNVRVRKIDELGNQIKFDASGHAVFHGPVMGGVQIGGQGNVQSVTITNTSNPDIAAALNGLSKLIAEASHSDLEKEEYQSAIQRIDALTKKEQTAEVRDLAKSKILTIETAMRAGGLALKAAPLIATLISYFG